MKNILLISGGLDSMVIYTTKLRDYIDECVYIKYRGDHPATIQELKVLEKAGIKPTILTIDDLKCDERGFYFGRNLRFMLAIREHFIGEDINVFIGNTANDNFSDNTRSYFYRLEDIINNSYPNSTMRITCPLQDMTKKQITYIAKTNNIPFYFCDKGDDEPCMKCHSCVAMKDAGYFD